MNLLIDNYDSFTYNLFHFLGELGEEVTVARNDKISAAEALRPKLIETRRDLHMHPELSNREERTARVVADKLRALGFDEIKTNVARHGVVALLKACSSAVEVPSAPAAAALSRWAIPAACAAVSSSEKTSSS